MNEIIGKVITIRMLFVGGYRRRNPRAVDGDRNALIALGFVETFGQPSRIFLSLSNNEIEMLIESFFAFFFQSCLLLELDELLFIEKNSNFNDFLYLIL